MKHIKIQFQGNKVNFILLIFLVGVSFSTSAFTIKIYGESHDFKKCVNQRKKLSKKANEKKIYLFSENVVVTNVSNELLKSHFEKFTKQFLGTKSLINIWGLEDAFPRTVSIALGRILTFLDALEKYKTSSNIEDLDKAKDSYQFFYEIIHIKLRMINASDALDIHLLPYSNFEKNYKSTKEIYLFLDSNVRPFAERARNHYKDILEKESSKKQLPLPSSLKDELNIYHVFTEQYPNARFEYLEEVDVTDILWRNHLMFSEFKKIMNSGNIKNDEKEVAIILGAAHVGHFLYLLQKDDQFSSHNFHVTLEMKCWEDAYHN